MPPIIVVINLISELVVHPKRPLTAESLGCLDAIHKIFLTCLFLLKVFQSHPLEHYLHQIFWFLHTHHLERQAINLCVKNLTMIYILVLKMRINCSTRHTFGTIIFLLHQ